MKTHWADIIISWPVITQHFDLDVLVMTLASARPTYYGPMTVSYIFRAN